MGAFEESDIAQKQGVLVRYAERNALAERYSGPDRVRIAPIIHRKKCFSEPLENQFAFRTILW